MTQSNDEYARLGIDYRKMGPWKDAVVEMGRTTFSFPSRYNVVVEPDGTYWYLGRGSPRWRSVTEGLGHKNLIAEWMYQNAGTGRTYHEHIGEDVMLMAVNDLKGALPVVYTDEVASGSSEWYEDRQRTADLISGFFRECQRDGIALVGGESPALPLLIRTEPYVPSAPSFSGCCVGIIPPGRSPITGEKLRAGDRIIGVRSTGLHSNGSTLIIRRSQQLSEQLLTRLPNGNTLGEEALIPTRSYVGLIEALLEAKVEIHTIVPGTGGGLRKIASDKRPFTYRIHSWIARDDIPPLFLFMRELGVTLEDCVKTFNWGIGEYLFVPSHEVVRTIEIGMRAGYELLEVGRVEEGERKVVFEPEGGIVLPPPEE